MYMRIKNICTKSQNYYKMDFYCCKLCIRKKKSHNVWSKCRMWMEMPFDSMSRGKRGVLERSTCPTESRAGPGQRRGDKRTDRPLPLVHFPPQGQRGGLELLPWQIWRCPVLLFLCSPSSCRKQHHAGHQILGKLWRFTVQMREWTLPPHTHAQPPPPSEKNRANGAKTSDMAGNLCKKKSQFRIRHKWYFVCEE